MTIAIPELDTIIDIIRSEMPGATLILFGSRLTGDARPDSDLDIAIVSPAPVDLLRLSEIKEKLSNSSIPYLVDIVDYQRVSPEFQLVIDQTGTRLA